MNHRGNSRENPSQQIDPEDQRRLKRIERLAWALLILFTLASLFFRSFKITFGVALGGALAILSYLWMKRFMMALILKGGGRVSRFTFLLYLTKYVILGVIVFLSIKYDIIHVLSLTLGFMVIVLAIVAESLRKTVDLNKEGENDTQL
jgi:hypothetical protein